MMTREGTTLASPRPRTRACVSRPSCPARPDIRLEHPLWRELMRVVAIKRAVSSVCRAGGRAGRMGERACTRVIRPVAPSPSEVRRSQTDRIVCTTKGQKLFSIYGRCVGPGAPKPPK